MEVNMVDLKMQYCSLKSEIDEAVTKVLSSGHYVLGENVNSFEKEFSAYFGTTYGVGVNSGTDALLLALKALDVGPGDEVVVPAFTIHADASVVALVGAKPVFAEIDHDTFNLDASSLKEKISSKTKAIIVVHLYGLPADMDEIRKAASSVPIVEDACQAAGSEYKGLKAGNLGTVACFSFYPTKNLGCTGDGGMVLTNDEIVAQRVKLLHLHGESKDYEQSELGINSRLDEIQAAVLRVKLKRLDKWNEERRKRAKIYNEELSGFASVPVLPSYAKHNYHLYTIRVEKRDELQKFLSENEIRTRVYYPRPLHLQKTMVFCGHKKGDFPESEKAAEQVLSLPISPEVSINQVEFVAKKIKQFYTK